MDGMDKPFQQAKTNNKGEWSVQNLAAGKWKFYFGGKQGLEEKTVDAAVGESGTVSVPDVTLAKPVDHDARDQCRDPEGGRPDADQAARRGAQDLPVAHRKVSAGAAAFRAQLHGAIAQTYMAENQAPQAIEQLKKATEIDPSNVDLQLAYGEILMQANQRAEGEKVLLALDITKVKDPFPFMNIIIGKINDQKADEALALLGKLMAQFPTENALYYYRGRANLAAKKMPEAKADLEKFVAAAPRDARELPDAKKILEQMKDIK